METADGVYLSVTLDRVACICGRVADGEYDLRYPIRKDGVCRLRMVGALNNGQAAQLLGMSLGYAYKVLVSWASRPGSADDFRIIRLTPYSTRVLERLESEDKQLDWLSMRLPNSTVVWVRTLRHLAPIRDSLRSLYE